MQPVWTLVSGHARRKPDERDLECQEVDIHDFFWLSAEARRSGRDQRRGV
jgi:hypothetical protein